MPTPKDEKLIAALEMTRDAAIRGINHVRQQREENRWLPCPSPSLAELAKGIQAALLVHPDFKNIENRTFGSKQLLLHPVYQSYNLVIQAALASPPFAVDWYRRICTIKKADLRYVAQVHGLALSKPLEFSNGVRLCRLDSLPESDTVLALKSQFDAYPNGPPWAILESLNASYATFILKNVRCDSPKPRSAQNAPPRLLGLETTERTVLAFTLAGNAAPVVGRSWIEFVDEDLGRAEYGSFWTIPTYEGRAPEIPAAVNAEAVQWVERYLALSPKVRKSCDIAIERLNLARRRLSDANKAIDGAICLEALLAPDDEHAEITYRLALRCARFLGSTLEDRRKISKQVKEFYGARSKTVHGKTTKNPAEMREAVAKGLELGARVLRRIVTMNYLFVPAEWELSDKDSSAPFAAGGAKDARNHKREK